MIWQICLHLSQVLLCHTINLVVKPPAKTSSGQMSFAVNEYHWMCSCFEPFSYNRSKAMTHFFHSLQHNFDSLFNQKRTWTCSFSAPCVMRSAFSRSLGEFQGKFRLVKMVSPVWYQYVKEKNLLQIFFNFHNHDQNSWKAQLFISLVSKFLYFSCKETQIFFGKFWAFVLMLVMKNFNMCMMHNKYWIKVAILLYKNSFLDQLCF